MSLISTLNKHTTEVVSLPSITISGPGPYIRDFDKQFKTQMRMCHFISVWIVCFDQEVQIDYPCPDNTCVTNKKEYVSGKSDHDIRNFELLAVILPECNLVLRIKFSID